MKAIIIGATGLIGNELLQLTDNDKSFSEIEIWVRKAISYSSDKVKVKIIDFDKMSELQNVTADVAFCCIGTTIKIAKTKEAFRKIDFDIPVNFAKILALSKINKYIVVSSIGADKNSQNFYLKTKGEMEDAISQTTISSIIFMRPSMLLGNRKEFRLGEIIGKYLMQLTGFLLIGRLKKYRAIQAKIVAKAMINAAKANYSGVKTIEYEEINVLANNL